MEPFHDLRSPWNLPQQACPAQRLERRLNVRARPILKHGTAAYREIATTFVHLDAAATIDRPFRQRAAPGDDVNTRSAHRPFGVRVVSR